MNSLFNKPIHIANFPAAADRSSLLLTSHQYHYLSPPLTPFPYYPFPSDQAELARSPRSNNGQSLPGLREMLPQQGHEALSTTDPEAHAYSPSAQQRHHERFIKESNEHNSSSIARGLQHLQDPTRIVPLYANPPPPIVQTTSIVSPLLRRNKAHVASACVNCKKAHLACDGKYPCMFYILSLENTFTQTPVPFPPFFFSISCSLTCSHKTQLRLHVKSELLMAHASSFEIFLIYFYFGLISRL